MKKRHVVFPSAMVILLFVIVLAAALTYVIPGGSFDTVTDPDTGIQSIQLESFTFQPATPVHFSEIPLRIVSAFVSGSTASIVLTYLFMGGSISILTSSGAFHALTGTLIRRLKGRRLVMVAGFTTLFSLCNMVLSPHAFVAFVPLSILFSQAMGYDAIVGVAMPLLGGAVAFSTGALLATTMMAQTLVGIPIFSGAGYRIFCQIVLLIPTILYIYRYGESVYSGRREAVLSPQQINQENTQQLMDAAISGKDISILLLFAATIVLIIVGSSRWSWNNLNISAAFLVLGIVVGLLSGNTLDKTLQMYLNGSKSMMGAAVLAGLAGAATGILSSGGIMHTVIYYASRFILWVPRTFHAPIMFTMHLLINCIIVSGGGQAAATMPIMGPIAQVCGIPLQTAVLTFNLGDGLGNYVLPYSNQLISYLEAGQIRYTQWMRFMGKLFLIWVTLAWILTAVSAYIWA
mgnify:FL=1